MLDPEAHRKKACTVKNCCTMCVTINYVILLPTSFPKHDPAMWQLINEKPSSVLEVMHMKQSCVVVRIDCAEKLQSLQQNWSIFMEKYLLLLRLNVACPRENTSCFTQIACCRPSNSLMMACGCCQLGRTLSRTWSSGMWRVVLLLPAAQPASLS